ncbi:hypothetical protein [Thalassococcus sp. S3]|uniref:hypothetical protein n=1 Tax=Thalassococcus sp. S3 TaxID=2017482 RepID=UPI00102421C4|nr:hypothetical protein [Thalassococcus sp. S3]QBF31030.1 hypothetical protein CFI11_07330 [Thalassococcus sp. S3]
MFPPFDIWSPIFRGPLSGDVVQQISPHILSPEIAGSAEVERRVVTEVASYGKQLGKVMDALQVLAEKAGVDLPEIDALVEGVAEVKADSKEELRAEAERALRRLRDVDEEGWRRLIGR